MTKERSAEVERAYHQEVVSRTAGVNSLPAGFSFAGLTLMVTSLQESELRTATTISMAASSSLLIVFAGLGALLVMATEISSVKGGSLERALLLYMAASGLAFLLMLTKVCLLAFAVRTSVGLIATAVSVVVLGLGILCWYWIGTHFVNTWLARFRA